VSKIELGNLGKSGTAESPLLLNPTELRVIEPMYARLLSDLPDGTEWLYEVKFDGYRCLAGIKLLVCANDDVALNSYAVTTHSTTSKC